jgi:hypothetical protein
VPDISRQVVSELNAIGGKIPESLTRFVRFGDAGKIESFATAQAKKQGLVQFEARTVGTPEGVTFAHWVFVVMREVSVAAFFSFALWILLKIILWFKLINDLHPTSNGVLGYKIQPLFRDPLSRYGLDALFPTYNLAIMIIAGGALYSSLQLPANPGLKDFAYAPGAGTLATRYFHATAIFAAIASVLYWPLVRYKISMAKASDGRLSTVRSAYKSATNESHRINLMKQTAEIRSQSTWPKADPNFNKLLAVIIIFFLLPFANYLGLLPQKLQAVALVPQHIREVVQDTAKLIYAPRPPRE